MPAINVSRTDTFETQRQKINAIGENLFSISQGGSDLSTGNLKLGDGTRTEPSLSFISDNTLGFYKGDVSTFGIVNNEKKIIDWAASSILNYKDVIVQRRSLYSEGIALLNSGSNYDPGSYLSVPVIGGTGEGATISMEVEAFGGTITQEGQGYTPGDYTSILLTGGNGTGAEVGFTITSLTGTITADGSGYVYDTEAFGVYENVPLILVSGNGSGAIANITVEEENGAVVGVDITDGGSGYTIGSVLSASNTNLGGSGNGFQFTIDGEAGDLTALEFIDKGSGYQTGDVLGLAGSTSTTATLGGSVSGVTTTLSVASTQITVTSTNGIVAGMNVVADINSTGQLDVETTVVSVDSSTTLTLSALPVVDGAATLDFTSPGELATVAVASTAGIFENSQVTVTGGTGSLAAGTYVISVDAENSQITLSEDPTGAGAVTLTFDPPYGAPSQAFQYTVGDVGTVNEVLVVEGGNGYSIGDVLSVNPSDVTQPIEYLVSAIQIVEIDFTTTLPASTFSVGDLLAVSGDDSGVNFSVREVNTSGGNLTSLVIDYPLVTLESGITGLVIDGTTSPVYTVNTIGESGFKYLIDTQDGNGPQYAPSLTFFVGNVYSFNLSDGTNGAHTFALSAFPDGIHGQSYVSGVNVTLDTTSTVVTVPSTTGIVVGMAVVVESGDGGLVENTLVSEINGNDITLSAAPLTSGAAALEFRGVPYTDGVTVEGTSQIVKVTSSTPTLYYYCANTEAAHALMGNGITIDPNNPKTFGSGFQISIADLDIIDVISNDIETGTVRALIFEGETANIQNGTFAFTLTTDQLTATTATLETISATTDLAVNAQTTTFTTDVNLGDGTTNFLTIEKVDGAFTTAGTIKTTSSLNVNDQLTITDNNIASAAGQDLILTPPSQRVAIIGGEAALTIPSGNTAARPADGIRGSGSIRFNTETNQYEGYSDINESWSSLGGVRDLDGNTTILAEETVGANDNTLWFINDNINTFKFTKDFMEFIETKKVRSLNTAAPDWTEWAANIPLTTDTYVKYRNSIFYVVSGGTSGTSGNEPTDTSGNDFSNGSSTLRYHTTAVSFISFEEVSEVRIDPLGFTDLVVNNEIRLSSNVISTTLSDLLITPSAGKKIKIDAPTSLVLPVGDNNSKGNPEQGSVRYNTDDNQFEGYNGAQWGGLGGVKDIDQDTEIKAESAPGADEDTLFFRNGGNNTLRITSTAMEFDSMDTITSVTSNTLNLEAAEVTFNSLALTIDTDAVDTCFLLSSRAQFDIGLSSGLNTDHLIRFNNVGETIYNLGFGTGTDDNITMLNSDLTNINYKNVRFATTKLELEAGVQNSGNALVYNTSTEASGRVMVTANNLTTGDKEIVEFLVIDNGTDVYFTDQTNIKTGAELISSLFDIDGGGNVRITLTLDSNLATNDNVEITVVNTVTKR